MIELEEKEITYLVQKVNLRAYGPKPDWCLRAVPSGQVPAIQVCPSRVFTLHPPFVVGLMHMLRLLSQLDGKEVVTEADKIISAIETEFPSYKVPCLSNKALYSIMLGE